jgi:hypothetical protein
VKNLGLTMDVTRRDQVNCVRRNVGFVLSRLWQFANVTPVMTRKKLVQSLVIPHFYIVTLFIPVLRWRSMKGLTWHLIHGKIHFWRPRSRSISSYSAQLLRFPLNTYFNFLRCSMMYRLIPTRCPGYLSDRLRVARSVRTMNIIVPPFNTTHRSTSFFVQGANDCYTKV